MVSGTTEQRVVVERDDLKGKIERLQQFILNNELYRSIPEAEKRRLARQLRYMNNYREVLDERIAAFPPSTNS